ncbi:ethanolamine utilization protein EutH [Schinkia azotoformans]|uniref:Ethanolamine utilization protein EutH n=1 Tax=Schinkia azotoformans LMG 9581 TaxID=1131731 RepID=K6C7W4_SCHAZ|nr:ethanolamine utilization protein EutH [Schinkia azotoformans]EKN67230.1 ethanolamine utilization protein EutH [Schinkia azotoformans LMG 9581]MEC1639931.1 ethanolamine utilization protein EutH [Schinkia azotoformans]MEC1722938.1 ethanolamine utilization protein EutH [Schinkia azotoformans]MEC1947100.1 ethanolamine utilization protein EutH [Schinkia azotoformans]MED4352879.1 ethanolamine utilization protein EutH [Schinkia azotoformans]
MGINNIIVYIVIGCFCLGAIDKCIGNRWGLGQRFTDGFMAMGSLTLAMVGIISLAPVLASILTPIIAPVYGLVGADPAAFANTLLAIDMGGYALATEMSQRADAELFSWVFLGTMMGPTLVFTIPVALGIIQKEDQPYFAKGILLGLITVPIGCLVGGVVADINILTIIKNLIPTIIFSVLISIGLWKYTNRMIAGFSIFAKCIEVLAIVGLTAISVQTLTGFMIIPNMAPLMDGIKTVAMIVLFLAGAFPLVAVISKTLHKPLGKIGALLGISETSTTGLVASLAHAIPMLSILKDMDSRGKVINVAFAVSGAFVFGGHLGFVAGINKEVVFAMIVGKLVGGLSAVILAVVATRKSRGKG